MNIKELKEAIKDLPDDMLVYTEHWEQSESGTSWPVESEVIHTKECLVSIYDKKYPYLDRTASGNVRKHGRYGQSYGKVLIIC
jgi:hypothetical protein